MKKEELFEVLGNLEPGMVEKARSDRHPRRGVWKKWTAAAACAVIIGGAVLGVATWRNGREGSAVRYPSGVTTVLAAYPASVERTMDAQKFVPGVDSKISRTAVGNGCILSEPDETNAGFRR